MICKNCGAEIKDTLKFCNKCGAKVEFLRPEEPVEEVSSATNELLTDVAINEVADPKPRAKHTPETDKTAEPKNEAVSSGKKPEKPKKEPKELDRSNPKSKIVAGLLALFLGLLGIQWFYLKKPLRAVVYILITLLGTFIVPGIVFIWELFLFGETIFFLVAKATTIEKYAQQAIRQKAVIKQEDSTTQAPSEI